MSGCFKSPRSLLLPFRSVRCHFPHHISSSSALVYVLSPGGGGGPCVRCHLGQTPSERVGENEFDTSFRACVRREGSKCEQGTRRRLGGGGRFLLLLLPQTLAKPYSSTICVVLRPHSAFLTIWGIYLMGSIDMRERQTHCIPTYLKDPFILVEKYFRRHQRKAHSSC